MTRILLVEDDEMLADGITMALEKEGYVVRTAGSLQEADRLLGRDAYALILLDINLPDGSGMDWCRSLRRAVQGVRLPVLMLTARNREPDEVEGLKAGADDYLKKPFSIDVLRLRVRALLLRCSQKEEVFCDGPFVFSFSDYRFTKDGRQLELGRTEVRVLEVLTANAGRVVTRAMLIEKVWPDGAQEVEENALSVSIRRLRSRLEEDPAAPVYIHTVYGIGYQWKEKKE